MVVTEVALDEVATHSADALASRIANEGARSDDLTIDDLTIDDLTVDDDSESPGTTIEQIDAESARKRDDDELESYRGRNR